MRISARSALNLALVLLPIGGVLIFASRQNAIARLRVEQQALVNDSREASRLAEENQDADRLRVELADYQKLQEANRDLPRLRSEISQLRRQAKELDSLRARNQRLKAQEQAVQSQPTAANPGALPPGFVPRSALADLGLATPEAAVHTFFFAVSRTNIDRASQCMLDGQAGLNADRDWQKREMARSMSNFNGFAIVSKREIAPAEVELNLQSSAAGPIMPMKLKHIGAEWKIDN